MGGGGSYYDRDTTSTSRRGSDGFSDFAESIMSKSRMDPALLPKDKIIQTKAKNTLVSPFDVTGSMDTLPKIIVDKWPMVVGQIYLNKYLEPSETAVSLSAIGDIQSDQGPIQICDFSKLRSLDEWLSRIWCEGNGGGQAKESYEMNAYYYARMCKMPNAVTPIYACTGDEGFRENILARDLREHFGGEHKDTDAWTVWNELKKTFKGNVYLIHRTYRSPEQNAWILKQWQRALGKEHVVDLPSDLAIADVLLGIITLTSGARDLKGYLEDVKNRPLDLGGEKFEPQSPERIAEVKESLSELAAYLALRQGTRKTKVTESASKKKKNISKKNISKRKEDWEM